MSDVPVVLFVCTHNAGRSQMAAALLDHAAAGRVRVTSAGSQPASQLNPAVVQAMAEIGLDISREYPKPLTGDKVAAADVVITMGCGDACPIYPGKRYEDWDLADPAGLSVEAVRPIRDAIRDRVQALLSGLDRLFAERAVDGLTEQVGVPGVPGGLLQQVQQHPAQREAPAVGERLH